MKNKYKSLIMVVGLALCASCSGGNNDRDEPHDAGATDADTDGPLFWGECGLEGQKVWCLDDWDCVYHYMVVACDIWGSCHDARENEYECNFMGEPCGYLGIPNGYICGHDYLCTVPCLTHDDCPGGECLCRRFSACRWFRCYQDTCPEHTTIVDGTLACDVKPEYLEGDCHGYIDGTCDASYIPVGERGCVPVQ